MSAADPAPAASGDTPGVVLGRRLGPFPGRLEGELIMRYAEATGDPNPGPRAGTAVPPVAIVTQIWEAQQAAFAELVPEAVRASMAGGVHGEHDVVLHRPLRPGEDLETFVEGHGSRRGGRHNLVTLRYLTYDLSGDLVAEQWWTTVLLRAAGAPTGEPAPTHLPAEGARCRPAGLYRCLADPGMPARYAGVSGDFSPHHFEVEAARRSGFDRPFLHGLCTMAICAQGVVSLVAGGDPERVRRVAVRFAAPAFVGEELLVEVQEAGGPLAYAFTAVSSGAPVVTNGWVELRPGAAPG